MPPAPFIDPAAFADTPTLYDLEAIRLWNPHRFEMEQLTAVVHLDVEARIIVGYKDVSPDEFWARGRASASMPHVLACESAAQLCSCYCHAAGIAPGGRLLFGGMEDVRFRGQAAPGDRLLLIGKEEKTNRRQLIFAAQAFVGRSMIFHGRVIGVPFVPKS